MFQFKLNILVFLMLASISTSLYSEPEVGKSNSSKTIIVQKGQTLSSISKEHLTDPSRWRELLKFNNIPNPNLIKPGLQLIIPDFLGKEPLAIVNFVTGKVDFRVGEGNQEWKRLKKGNELFPLDTIRTEQNSNTDIIVKDSGIIRIYPNSLVQVSYLQHQKSVPEINLRKGSLDAFISKVIQVKSNEKTDKLRVVTPSSVAAVRGTDFNVLVDAENNSTIACYDGLVSVSAENKTVELTKGYATFVELGKPPLEPFKIPDPPKLKQ